MDYAKLLTDNATTHVLALIAEGKKTHQELVKEETPMPLGDEYSKGGVAIDVVFDVLPVDGPTPNDEHFKTWEDAYWQAVKDHAPVTPIELHNDCAYHISPSSWSRKCLPLSGGILSEWLPYESGDMPECLGDLEDGPSLQFWDADDPENKHNERECHKNTWIMPPYTARGDYTSGRSLCEANARTLVDEIKKLVEDGDDSWEQYVCELPGMYDYHALYIRADIGRIDPQKRIQELLNILNGHPVLNEDTHSEVEREWAERDWKENGPSEYTDALSKAYPDLKDEIKKLESGELELLFYNCGGWVTENNMYSEAEGAYGYMAHDYERAAKTTDLTNLEAAIARNKEGSKNEG